MKPRAIKTIASKLNLLNRNNVKVNYEPEKVEEVNNYSEPNNDFILDSFFSFFTSGQENVNATLVDEEYVINIFGNRIDLEEQLDSVIKSLPFEVVLTLEDKSEILGIIKDNPLAFYSISNDIDLDYILKIVKILDGNMDISYDRISKIVPDIDNVIKNYVDPYVGDILTIDYSNIGDLWDAFLSGRSSKLNKAIDKCCPNFNEELSKYIYDNLNIIIDSEEIDTANVLANFATDIQGNLETIEKLKEDLVECLKEDGIFNKFEVATKVLCYLANLGITPGDVAHIVHDTGADLISKNVTSAVRDIPYVGNDLVNIGINISNGYNYLAENSSSIPIIGDGLHYMMTTDIVDKAEDLYDVGAKFCSDMYSIGTNIVNGILSW